MNRASKFFAIVFVVGTTVINSMAHAQTPAIVLADPIRGSDVAESVEPSSINPNEFQSFKSFKEEIANAPDTGVVKSLLMDEIPTSGQAAISSSAPASHFESSAFQPIAETSALPLPAVASFASNHNVPASSSKETFASAEEQEPIPFSQPMAQTSPSDLAPPSIAIRPTPLRPIRVGGDSSYQVRMEPLASDPNQYRMIVEIPESVREMEIAPKYAEGNRRMRVTIDHESGIADVRKDESMGLVQEREMQNQGSQSSTFRPAFNGMETRMENHANFGTDARLAAAGQRQFQKNPYFDQSSRQSSAEGLARDRMLKPIPNPYASTEYRAIEETVDGNTPVGSATQGVPVQASASGPYRAPVQIQLSDESVNGNGALYR